MDDILDKLLVETFPNLYKDRYGDIKHTLMPFGFEVGSGWYKLLCEVSLKLEELIEAYIEENPDDPNRPKAVQVKEKFGTLRFYMDKSTEEMHKFILKGEEVSGHICEECGEPGTTKKAGTWMFTRCNYCWNILKEKFDKINKGEQNE